MHSKIFGKAYLTVTWYVYIFYIFYTYHIKGRLSHKFGYAFRCFLEQDVSWDKRRKEKRVYNYHLANCRNRPVIIDDDKSINEKIDAILAEHTILKKEKKKEKNAFLCPYCSKTYTGANLRHLLACAQRNPDDQIKLQAFFNANWLFVWCIYISRFLSNQTFEEKRLLMIIYKVDRCIYEKGY